MPNKTLHQFVVEYLISKGLWPSEAEAIFEVMKVDPANVVMKDRWGDAGYPASILVCASMSADEAAKEWLEKNKPQHWARPMFDEKMMAEIKAKQAAK